MSYPSSLWDIFCQVVDNHGDLGVCWRLSQHLLNLGQRVRLFIDQPEGLTWMAPHRHELEAQHQLTVLPWPNDLLWSNPSPNDWEKPQCVVEAFGCEIPQTYLARLCEPPKAQDPSLVGERSKPSWTWINLEYLSAEDYPERMHQLPSPVMQGAAKGMTKWFFYPGFTPQTGGLLKRLEPTRADTTHNQSLKGSDSPDLIWNPQAQLKVFLFSYEPPALTGLLRQWLQLQTPTHLKVSFGRSHALVQSTLESTEFKPWVRHESKRFKHMNLLTIEFIDALDHPQFDALLASSDLNFVRGEDSWIRAIWAQKAFIWQIYPQDDGVHLIKMNAFLKRFDAPESLQKVFRVWNGFETTPLPVLSPEEILVWTQWTQKLASHLDAMPDLSEQLCDFLALQQRESRPLLS